MWDTEMYRQRRELGLLWKVGLLLLCRDNRFLTEYNIKFVFLPLRPYTVSTTLKTYCEAYDFCESKGLGLAIWDTAELYEDIKYLAGALNNHIYTALNNGNGQECDDKASCSGKLLWRQEKNGPCRVFQEIPELPK